MVTQSQLQQVSDYAELFFTLEEISVLTMVDLEELRREVNFGYSDLNKAYWTGKMAGAVELRKNVKDWAKKGAPGAEQQLMEWARDQKESE